jgi:hypothetical protein
MQIETPQEIRAYGPSTQTLTVLQATQGGHLGGRDYMHLCVVREADGQAFDAVAYLATMRSHGAASVRDDLRHAAREGTPIVAAVRPYHGTHIEAGRRLAADLEIVDYVAPETDEQLRACAACDEQLPGVRNQLDLYAASVEDRREYADFCVSCAYQREMDV